MHRRTAGAALCAVAMLLAACADDARDRELREAVSAPLEQAAEVDRIIEDQAAAQRRAIEAQSE